MRSSGRVSIMPANQWLHIITPRVADVGGLGQAGGARGVDVERAVVDRHRAALGTVERAVGMAREIAVDAARNPSASRAVRPERGTQREMRQRAGEALGELRRDDDVPAAPRCRCNARATRPVRLVLSSATTPPTRVMPSQIAM